MEIEEVLKLENRFKDVSFIAPLIKDDNVRYISHNNGSHRDLTREYIYDLYDVLINIKRNDKSFFWLMSVTTFHVILALYSFSTYVFTKEKTNIYFLGSPVIFGPVPDRIYLINAKDIHYDGDMWAIDNSPVFGAIKDLHGPPLEEIIEGLRQK